MKDAKITEISKSKDGKRRMVVIHPEDGGTITQHQHRGPSGNWVYKPTKTQV